jgi:hypothetical protein
LAIRYGNIGGSQFRDRALHRHMVVIECRLAASRRRFAMIISRRTATFGSLGLLGTTSASTLSRAEWSELNIGEGFEDFWLATDAYIYGYPLVTMEMTRRVMTNVATPQGNRGPMGQLIKAREYPNASFRDVTAPNADTLYTTAWIEYDRVDRRWRGAVGLEHP